MGTQQIPGQFYDWTHTKKPERPWIHQYHQTLVDKIYLATKANPITGERPSVILTFEQALERIRQINQVTRGIPKITYLVGWQYDGHDSKYPDWAEVNMRLKRSEDKTAADSLVWLMDEATTSNTTVSLHINMLDAYEDAPSWSTYLDNDVIVKKDGVLYKHERAVWGGQQAYWIDYAREWVSGLAQRRIDNLLELLPIRRQGTVHIDAFAIPLHTNPAEQKTAMRQIFRYWRMHGIDVTSENQWDGRAGEGFIGLQPMAWHLNPNYGGWRYTAEHPEVSDETWMDIPSSLCCGGVDWIGLETGQLFGSSMQGETIANVDDFIRPFCLQTLPWYFLNRHERLHLTKDAQSRELVLTDGVTSQVENGHRTIRLDGHLLLVGEDVCVPAQWRKTREIIAFSGAGYTSRDWVLPSEWQDISSVDVYRINKHGLSRAGSQRVSDGKLSLSLLAGQALSIVPAGTTTSELNAPGITSRTIN